MHDWGDRLASVLSTSVSPISPVHHAILGSLRLNFGRYVEGIDVLYSTNTFVVESQPLLDALLRQHENLHRCLLVPERLNMIRSLELKWNFVLFAIDTTVQERDRTTFETYMRLLPRAFPNQTRLYITFGWELYRRIREPEECLDEIDSVFLETIAGMVRRSTLQNCTIEVPFNLFMALRHRAIDAGTKVIHSPAITEVKVWHSVSEERGYWITWGEDIPSTRPSVLH